MASGSAEPFQDAALSLALSATLFESLPRTPFFVKDHMLRYVKANTAMAELCGVESRADLLGKTAGDVLPESVRARWEALDRQVMRARKPLTDKLDLCVRLRGPPVWLICGRWPIFASDGGVIAIAGIARILEADRRQAGYGRLATAIEYMHARFAAPLDIGQLARRAGVSVCQLKRDFVSVLGIPPRRYLTKVRLEAALDRLTTDEPIVDVAHACGYADQSAFTRRFRAAVGMSPTEYRRVMSGANAVDRLRLSA